MLELTAPISGRDCASAIIYPCWRIPPLANNTATVARRGLLPQAGGEGPQGEFGNKGATVSIARGKLLACKQTWCGATGAWCLTIGATTLSLSFQLRRRVLPWVYDLSLGRASTHSFWMRQLQEFAVPPRGRRVRPIHRSHPAPGHRARDWGRPSVNKRLLRCLRVLVPQFQAPAQMRCPSPLG